MFRSASKRALPVIVCSLLSAGAALCDERPEGQANEVLVSILTVVGSTPGQFGSFFKTSLQAYNPNSTTLTYRLVFHPTGVAGSPSDPSFSGSVPPGTAIFYPDLLPVMGISGGLGSIDVYVPPNELTMPTAVVARVYNDAGSAGTTGFSEEFVPPGKFFGPGIPLLLITSPDPSRFRYNIGVRTLGAGAQITATLRTSSGSTITTVTKSYPANFFEQVGITNFFPGVTFTGNETITIFIDSGSALFYGALTDNTTQDPSVGVAQP
jgi:hypothetical protein